MPDLSNVGDINDDNEKVKGIILSYLYERRNQGRTTLDQIKKRIAAYREDLVEMDFRNLFLDNNWVDFSGSDGSAAITTDGIKECERRSNEDKIT